MRTTAHEQTSAYFTRAPWTSVAAGPWMSFPGDPEDCGMCVNVSLINSNTEAFGSCGQVNETQCEGAFSGFPPRMEAAGDGMRLSDWLPPLPQRPHSPPTGRPDTLFEMNYSSSSHFISFLLMKYVYGEFPPVEKFLHDDLPKACDKHRKRLSTDAPHNATCSH